MKGLVPEENIKKLVKKLKNLQRRAEKLGLEPLTFELLGEVILTPEEGGDMGLRIKAREVVIEGEPPKLAGWIFVAKINREECLILSPSGEEVPIEFRELDFYRCDHCKTKIWRVRAFIVRHEETGEYKQVGSTCVADFLGHDSVEALLRYASQLAGLEEWFVGMCRLGGRRAAWADLATVLAVTSRVIAEKGWVSRSAARDDFDLVPTSDHVEAAVFGAEWEKYEPRERDWDDARGAIEWILAQDSREISQYLFNCYKVAQEEVVNMRSIGFATSLLPTFLRKTGRWGRETHKWGHVGKVGEGIELEVTLSSVLTLRNDWGGTSHLHKFSNTAGNLLIWWSPVRIDLTQGEVIKIKARVKSHGVFREQDQTVLHKLEILGEP